MKISSVVPDGVCFENEKAKEAFMKLYTSYTSGPHCDSIPMQQAAITDALAVANQADRNEKVISEHDVQLLKSTRDGLIGDYAWRASKKLGVYQARWDLTQVPVCNKKPLRPKKEA